MPSVHEQGPHQLIFGPAAVVQAIIEDDKGAWVDGALFVSFHLRLALFHHGFLSSQNILDQNAVIFFVDEKFGNQFSIKSVTRFCPGNDGSNGNVLMMI